MYFIHYIFIFVTGTVIGSFANVVIYRLKKKKKGIFGGRSYCPKCRHTLSFLDLMPILSYILLHFRCRYCNKKIDFKYTLVEITMGLLFVFTLYMLKNSISLPFPTLKQIVVLSVHLFYIFILTTITFYDIYYREIPDQVILPAIIIGLLFSFLNFTPTLKESILGALIPLIFFGAQLFISQGKWIGGGDLRIGAFMGIILGVGQTIVALFIAYLIGSFVGIFLIIAKKAKMKSAVPFGPMLSIGILISLFFGRTIISWYWGLLL